MPALEAPNLEELEIAGIKLVDAIVEYRRDNPSRISTVPPKKEDEHTLFNPISAMDLVETDDNVIRLRDIVADPVGSALKRELKKVGQAIYDIVGSTDKLREVGERIADRDPNQWQRRMSPIDSAWNGVGSGDDRWWS